MRNINLRHFIALPVIAETGSLSAAAERLHLSQSALTQAVRKIEVTVGTPLFERAGFGVTPSDAGRLLVGRAGRASALLSRAKRELRRYQSGNSSHRTLNRHMTGSQLRAFIAIVETGGYSLAARKLGLAQPTIYRAAKDIETQFKMLFFRPTAKGVEANEAARLLARYAELAFSEIRQGLEEVRELRGHMQSRIAVGCLPLARAKLLPQAVTRLLDIYPDARVSILDGPYEEQLHALRYGHIDWIIGALRKPAPTSDIVQHHLFEESLSIIVRTGHPMLKNGLTTPAALAKLAWIAPKEHTPARDLFTTFFSHAGVTTPQRIIECSSLVATRGLLQASDRAALLSLSQINGEVVSGQLAILGAPLPETSRAIGLTTRSEWEPTVVQAEFTRIIRVLSELI